MVCYWILFETNLSELHSGTFELIVGIVTRLSLAQAWVKLNPDRNSFKMGQQDLNMKTRTEVLNWVDKI